MNADIAAAVLILAALGCFAWAAITARPKDGKGS